MSSNSLSLKEWINTRHIIQNTQSTLLTENSADILKSFGGIQRCLLLLLSSRSLLSQEECDAIKQIISDTKASEDRDPSDKRDEKPLTLNTLDSNSLGFISNFLSKSEIASCFKNVCSKMAIVGLGVMQQTNINIIKASNIEYQYEFSGKAKLFRSFNMRVANTMDTKTMFMRCAQAHNMNPYRSAIYKTTKVIAKETISAIPTINVANIITNNNSTVLDMDLSQNYMICESMQDVDSNSTDLLLSIKYFDIFDQKLYAEYIIFDTKTSIPPFIEYIVSKMIANTTNKYTKTEFIHSKSDLQKKLLFYSTNVNDQTLTTLNFNEATFLQDVHDITIDSLSCIIFQLNPKKITSDYSQLQVQVENDGGFWYDDVCKYIESRNRLVRVKISARKGHQTVLLHNDIEPTKYKWFLDKRTTYGMIRKRLSKYLHIDPIHIEIWKPVNMEANVTFLWDFGAKGKGKWDEIIGDLLEKYTICDDIYHLKFEMQPYNVKDFDAMILYNNLDKKHKQEPSDLCETRIMKLAMYNVKICIPDTMPSKQQMTIAFRQSWTAYDILLYILNKMIAIPAFGYAFFGQVIEYIKKHEMEESYEDNDLSILQNLKPNRFLLVRVQKWQHSVDMIQKWQMPTTYSPVKYTDFEIHFLARNDPRASLKPKAFWITIYDSYTKKDKKNKKNKKDKNTKLGHIRTLLQKNQSLIDVLKTHIDGEELDDILKTHKFSIKIADKETYLDKEELENCGIYNTLDIETKLYIYILKTNKS